VSAPIPAPDTPQGQSLSPQQQVTQATAAADSAVHTQARDLATLLAVDPQISAMIIKGVVTAINLAGTPPTLSAQLAGDTSSSVSLIRFIDSYTPVVGDTCLIIKQGSDIFCIGQMNDNGSGSANGWVQPTLGTNFTHSADPIMYRLINDHGDNKIQLRGSCTHTSTNTALWTMPTGFRPATNRVVLIARDNTQSNVAQLLINTDGTMVLGGATTGVAASSGGPTGSRTNVDPGTANTSSVTPGVTGNTDVNHTHFSSDGPNPATNTSWTTYINNGFTNHNHSSAAHNHVGGVHQHALDLVANPTALWFHDVEYFLI